MKIVHITPHLGGGVGSVVLAWLVNDRLNTHQIITLDYANEQAKKRLADAQIECFSQPSVRVIDELVYKADIVVIHFWNHPLLYKLLLTHIFPPARMAFWAHISGLSAPNIITEKVVSFPDRFVLTTPISRSIDAVKYAEVIMSTSGVQRFLNISKESHTGFVVGYVGTVDYAKMHPDYIRINEQIDADKFLIIGGNDEKRISAEADERFEFTGKVSDIRPYLAQMDVFGYLLNEKHFGTCEQAIQEAMAAGIPIVTLDNPCESSLIKDGVTGLIAHSKEEYIALVKKLKNDRKLYDEIVENGRRYAEKYFSLEYMIDRWNEVFMSMLKEHKYIHRWANHDPDRDSFDIFCESIGQELATIFASGDIEKIAKLLADPNLKSDSKGTPKQYYAFLKGKRLAEICKLYSL